MRKALVAWYCCHHARHARTAATGLAMGAARNARGREPRSGLLASELVANDTIERPMSYAYGMDLRERWRNRNVVLRRWLVKIGDRVNDGQPVCEIEADAGLITLPCSTPDGFLWVRDFYVSEDEEVPPDGFFLEASSGGLITPPPVNIPKGIGPLVSVQTDLRPHRIFISYRHKDTEAYAGRLHEVLVRNFGADDVFMDIFSIRPGDEFERAIQRAAASCVVMLVLIGNDWLQASATDGRRRLDDNRDYVRREVTAALDRRAWLVPVLVQEASLPRRAELPWEMGRLVSRQAVRLSARHWETDAHDLIRTLSPLLGAVRS